MKRGIGLVCLVAAACGGGKIHSFTASRQFVCPAEKVTLAWKTTGKTTLSAEPAGAAGMGSVAEEGSVDVAIQATTVFTLKAAKSGGTATRKQEVALGEGRDQPIGGDSQTCDASGVSTTFEVAGEDWDDRLRIATIDGSVMARPLKIEHAGKTVDLGPQAQTSDALAGEKISGSWTIRTPLAPGEQCGVQQSGIPASLSVKVRVGCAGGGSP
jgi:hypothetical protein